MTFIRFFCLAGEPAFGPRPDRTRVASVRYLEAYCQRISSFSTTVKRRGRHLSWHPTPQLNLLNLNRFNVQQSRVALGLEPMTR
ncbi:hypothetical protein TNCV_3838461 [Trichonephila clavipes]|nr:hypothetical protein TNCV_3838461 [Trichonephila clavipes]